MIVWTAANPDPRNADPESRWHGTAGGYSNHSCRCPRCTDAWRVYYLNYNRRVRASK
jgi:hypothetical protein